MPLNDPIERRLEELVTKLKVIEVAGRETDEALKRISDAADAAAKEALSAQSAANKASEAADQATARSAAAEKVAGQATKDVGKAVLDAAAATQAATGADGKATEAVRSAALASRAATGADRKATEARARVDGLAAALGDGQNIPLPGPAASYPFLTVAVPDTEFDGVAQSAIEDVRAAFPVDRDRLAASLVSKGLASSAGRVAKILGRARISETRRHILAAVYPYLLDQQLGDPPNGRRLKDPPGLAQNLLLQLDSDGGGVDRFADFVVAHSERELSVQLNDRDRAALKRRVRESV